MADVILDVGVFNVKDELVFVDETFCLSLREEEVISVPDESKSEINVGNGLIPVVNGSIPLVVCKLESTPWLNLDSNNRGDDSNAVKENGEDTLQHSLTSFTSESVPAKTSEEFDCFKCNRFFKSHEHLACHMESHTHNHVIEVTVDENGKRVWACKQCDKTFISRKGSVIHLRTHTGERPFTCKVCGKKFIDSSTLMKHQVIHQATRPFTCSICRRGFNQKVALQRHESTHSLQPLFTCKYCPKTFLVQSSLQAHENIHSRVKPYICGFCPSRFHTLTLQKQHERVHTNERPYVCNFCPKAFKDSGTLFKHQVIHSGTKPYSCPLCSNGFTQKVAVRKHIRTHVLKASSKQCPICKISINNPDELCFHLEKHVLENPHLVAKPHKVKIQKSLSVVKPVESDLSDLATLCDVAISTSGNYFCNEIDTNSSRGRFFCVYCGMRYKRERTLNAHLTGVHLFCLLCTTKFYDRTKLEMHDCGGNKSLKNGLFCKSTNRVKMKPGSRQFYCERCCKSFTSRNGFVIHQRSHTGERPYACRWCDKAFGDSATRHKHERIHTGERPFKCLSCPRAFNQRAALRAHQVTHSCNRAFTCQHCPSSFPYATTLRKHIATCHSDILEVSCPLCAKVSCDSNTLHSHIRTVHVEGESQVCTLCDSGVFTNSGEYCDHVLWHAKQHILDCCIRKKRHQRPKGKSNENKRAFHERKYSID